MDRLSLQQENIHTVSYGIQSKLLNLLLKGIDFFSGKHEQIDQLRKN